MSLTTYKSKRICVLVIFVCAAAKGPWSLGKDFVCKSNKVQFRCKSENKCIPKRWECDNEKDCEDNSDEKHCGSCDVRNKFSCKRHRGERLCISRQWVCDGSPDCKDGSDETKELCVNASCSHHEFRCASPRRCIPKEWVCDHENDCDDGSDELSCPSKSCPETSFQCTNKKCIDKRWRCDHDNDCDDDSDEHGCNHPACLKSEFRCNNSRCILREAFCDDFYDCTDHSDEPLGCTPHKRHANCLKDQFNCKDGTCIRNNWVCDGDKDCASGEDEKNCTTGCLAHHIKCLNGRCIQKALKCDGKPDCEDGSDEKGCEYSPNFVEEHYFKCETNGKWFNASAVCDGKINCPGGSDEKLCGVNECSTDKGGCEHVCNDLKIGFRCSCRPGFELAKNKKNCTVTDQCKEIGKCSQVCQNNEGGYKCSCVAGYALDGRDLRSCKAIERNPYLIFSDRHSIRKLTLHKSQFFGIVRNLPATIAVDYHLGEGYMYWTDVKSGAIQRAMLKREGQEKIVKETIVEKVHTANGIAVDWVTGKLYWTDAWFKRIEVSDLLGKYRRALITGLDMPRAIVLHPSLGEMFWTDWGEKPRIEKCGMDGDPKSRNAIITTKILWPNALTIDYTIDHIWWADAKRRVIEHCDLNGENRKVILGSEKVFHPFSIAVFEDIVYWTDWHQTSIYQANKFSGQNVTRLKKGLLHPLGISVIHPQRQPGVFNFCQKYNGDCSHLCLLSARRSKTERRSCACPQGITMLSDKRTCNTSDALKCTKGRCNNGTCIPGNATDGPQCRCNAGFTGSRCEDVIYGVNPPKNNNSDKADANVVTIGITVGVVALIFICSAVVSYVLYRRIKKKYSPNSLNFDNPVYSKTTESIDAGGSGGSLLPFIFRKSPPKQPFAKDPEPLDL